MKRTIPALILLLSACAAPQVDRADIRAAAIAASAPVPGLEALLKEGE